MRSLCVRMAHPFFFKSAHRSTRSRRRWHKRGKTLLERRPSGTIRRSARSVEPHSPSEAPAGASTNTSASDGCVDACVDVIPPFLAPQGAEIFKEYGVSYDKTLIAEPSEASGDALGKILSELPALLLPWRRGRTGEREKGASGGGGGTEKHSLPSWPQVSTCKHRPA